MDNLSSHTFPPDLTARIQQNVEAHLYPSPEDVIRHALDTLDAWREHERREVLKGLAQANRGEVSPLNMAEIIREAREQWDAQHP